MDDDAVADGKNKLISVGEILDHKLLHLRQGGGEILLRDAWGVACSMTVAVGVQKDTTESRVCKSSENGERRAKQGSILTS